MKKTVLLILAALLCLSLSGCKEEPRPTGTTQAGVTDTTNATDQTGSATGFVEVQKPETLPASGWLAGLEACQQPFAISGGGVYFLMNQCLCYMDTATGHTVFLCSKPGCMHGESTSGSALRSCDAYVYDLVNVMFCHDGSLFYTTMEDENGYTLYARDLDGTNLRKVTMLCDELASRDISVQFKRWVYACGDLYYTVCIQKLAIEENGTQINYQTDDVLMRYDLAAGKEEELLRSKDEAISLCGVNDDMAIVYMTHLPTSEEIKRPDYTEYMKQFAAYLRLWHEDSGGVSTLCEMERGTCGTTIGFSGGKYHMFGGNGTKIYAYDLVTGTFGESDLPADVNRIWSEKYAGVSWDGYYDLETGTFYPNEYDTMQLPTGIDSFGASPEAFADQGLIVIEFYSKDKRGVFDNYVYFPFDKMDDGMQLSDRIVFMSRDADGYHILQPEDGSKPGLG